MKLYRETYPKFSRPGTWVHGKQWAVTEEEGRHHLTIPPNNRVASVLGDELCRNCTGFVHRLDPWCRSLGFTDFHAATAVYLSISRAIYLIGMARHQPCACRFVYRRPVILLRFRRLWSLPGNRPACRRAMQARRARADSRGGHAYVFQSRYTGSSRVLRSS